ncbi:MAG: hypothetical protein NC113_08760 [Bacteroides sp.]|nr:hypothetical protein [Bacteroides sp.]MCM1448288.1 hypothetical protein [Bacteroides sp.]
MLYYACLRASNKDKEVPDLVDFIAELTTARLKAIGEYFWKQWETLEGEPGEETRHVARIFPRAADIRRGRRLSGRTEPQALPRLQPGKDDNLRHRPAVRQELQGAHIPVGEGRSRGQAAYRGRGGAAAEGGEGMGEASQLQKEMTGTDGRDMHPSVFVLTPLASP